MVLDISMPSTMYAFSLLLPCTVVVDWRNDSEPPTSSLLTMTLGMTRAIAHTSDRTGSVFRRLTRQHRLIEGAARIEQRRFAADDNVLGHLSELEPHVDACGHVGTDGHVFLNRRLEAGQLRFDGVRARERVSGIDRRRGCPSPPADSRRCFRRRW
jgi:hypothetical protein